MSSNNKLNLYIQPAYNCKTKNIEYAEILIRGFMGSNSVPKILKFIEVNKLESQFDLDILSETLRIINHYEKLEYPIGINLCPNTIKEDGIADKIIQIINENNKSCNEIIIEVNEKTEFKDKIVRKNMKKLRDNNIKIALDDFGVEGANLYTLLECNLDIIKVDKAFIDRTDVEYEESQYKILRRLLQLCNDFNLKHIVEGIETTKQLKNLENIGYTVIQGYLYKKPLPLIEFLSTEANRKDIQQYESI